jgi:hypothetical protein
MIDVLIIRQLAEQSGKLFHGMSEVTFWKTTAGWNTTATTPEEFAKTKFVPAYNAIKEASFSENIKGYFLKSFLSVAGDVY